MQLHRSIPDRDIPDVLKKRLSFGDTEQISALNSLEADIERIEEEKARIEAGDLIYYDVCIEYTGEENVRVLACSKEEAREKAEAEADIHTVTDLEIDHIFVTEAKSCRSEIRQN
jgi:endonuclease/exonuclease/phosphatase family metal-dependent hydrolase